MEDKFFKPIAFKIDDEIELQSLNDEIYNQLAKSTAKLIDVDFAKTPVVDLFTGYQRCFVLEKENQELKDRIDKAVEITHKILMNNADNRMICVDEEKEYFDWLDKEMLNQEKILKGDKE